MDTLFLASKNMGNPAFPAGVRGTVEQGVLTLMWLYAYFHGFTILKRCKRNYRLLHGYGVEISRGGHHIGNGVRGATGGESVLLWGVLAEVVRAFIPQIHLNHVILASNEVGHEQGEHDRGKNRNVPGCSWLCGSGCPGSGYDLSIGQGVGIGVFVGEHG